MKKLDLTDEERRERKNQQNRESYYRNIEKAKITLENYRIANRELLREKAKKYYEEKPEIAKAYRINNREKINEKFKEYMRKKKAETPFYTIAHRIRGAAYRFLFNPPKKSIYINIMGCTPEHFKNYIESLFREGMCFENYGICWQLDHIIPLRAFNLTDSEQYLKATHYTNIQPLFKEENQSKCDKINGINARNIYSFSSESSS